MSPLRMLPFPGVRAHRGAHAAPLLAGAPRRPGTTALLRVLIAWVLALAAALVINPALAQALQPVPPLTARVIDRSATLSAPQLQALEDKLAAYETAQGSQIVVLLVPTTQPEDIAAYAFRVADTWKIGRREVGDGILLVVAKEDRKVRIEVARTLEGAVPDLAAWRIIDGVITPAFRRGDFAGGLDAGVDGLIALIRGEALPAPAQGRAPDEGMNLEDLGALLFVAVPMLGAVLVGRRARWPAAHHHHTLWHQGGYQTAIGQFPSGLRVLNARHRQAGHPQTGAGRRGELLSPRYGGLKTHH